MNRQALWILVFASATVFFGWETYKACTGPVIPGERTPAETAFPSGTSAGSPRVPAGDDAALSGMSSLIARPVFRPDRRPYKGETAGVPSRNYETELSRFTVLGVLTMSDRMVALVVGKGGGTGERWEVGAGDSLPGFTVKEVTQDGLVLTADNRDFPLPLYAGGPKTSGTGSLRTEVAPAPSAAASQPRPVARPVPGAGSVLPSTPAPPTTTQPVLGGTPPRVPRRRLPGPQIQRRR